MTQPSGTTDKGKGKAKGKGKPILVGCLVVVAVVLIAGGAAAYYFLGRPALSAFNAARDLGKIQQIERRVSNRSSFSPPASGELTAQQVDRYLAVSGQVMSSLENRVEVLDERYRDLSSRANFTGFREAIFAWSDLLRLIVEAKEAQVDALNSSGFSLDEYSWVRSQVLTAAGITFFEVDLAQLVADAADPTVQRQQAAQVPQANVELVAPHAQELERLVPLAVFGL